MEKFKDMQFNMRLPRDLYDQIKAFLNGTGSVSAFIREAVAEKLDREKYKNEI